jgi:hypothetical protein
LTVDEELNKLEDDLRRLKIEYEIYFNGASPRPPNDMLFRVEIIIKRYSSDQSKLNLNQRFRFNSLVQKYSVQNTLWRRKLQEKEEGRTLAGHPKRSGAKLKGFQPSKPAHTPTRVVCADPDAESEKVAQLLDAMKRAKVQLGDSSGEINPKAFQKFIREKTQQVKDKLGCEKVQFSVYIEDGKVKFKATRAE